MGKGKVFGQSRNVRSFEEFWEFEGIWVFEAEELEGMLRLAGLNCKLALRTPWILRMLCFCLCSDPKMRLDTWENTVLIYSTVIQAGHQPAVKSCWKVLKLGNNIGSRAKPTVLFLRLGALFQNYCLAFSCSLVFKRDPFNTNNYHNLGSVIFIFIFF